MKNDKVIPLCDIVGFHDIKIYQPSNSFRMTSDSLALANFVELRYTDRNILDIGTGLGVIPLVLSLRGDFHITGVEIDENISEVAQMSVAYNKLENQISICNQDIRDYSKFCDPNIFDIIVSNPPYFSVSDGHLNSNDVLRNARHNTTLQLEDIFKIAKKLLKDRGRLVLVFTTDRLFEAIDLYQQYHFAIKRIQFIHGGTDKCAKSFLIEGSKNGKSGAKVCAPFILK